MKAKAYAEVTEVVGADILLKDYIKMWGLKKRDGNRPKVVIDLTVPAILAGRRYSPDSCPMSIAAKFLPGVKAAYVFETVTWIHFEGSDYMERYINTPEMTSQIKRVHHGKSMKPGKYELRRAEGTERLDHPSRQGGNKPRPGNRKAPTHVRVDGIVNRNRRRPGSRIKAYAVAIA